MDRKLPGRCGVVARSLSSWREIRMKIFQGDAGVESPQEFSARVGFNFNDHLILSRALTHRSYLNEHPEAIEDNERLEFLGDAVLDYVVGAWAVQSFSRNGRG